VLLAGERFGERNEFDYDVRKSISDTFAEQLTEKRLTFTRS
jgi:hypothetical protein